jgi:hypothetical protein
MQPDHPFRTTSFCPDGAANCLGVAFHQGGAVLLSEIAHGKPVGPEIILTRDEWTAFLAGAKAGEFELPQP